MSGVENISRSVGQSWLAVVWVFLIAYFAVHAFQGDSSLLALKGLQIQQFELQAQAEAVALRRATLEGQVARMGGATVDPDLLEELVRKKLGFTHPDEVILFLE